MSDSGKVTSDRELQPEKADIPMNFSPSGRFIVLIEVQFLKVRSFISTSFSGMLVLFPPRMLPKHPSSRQTVLQGRIAKARKRRQKKRKS
jgi:hypothetical protein